MPPLVSIIITTKNERANVGNCLSSIKKQTYNQEDIEIIVVDNNSTDETKDIARQYTDKVYNYGPERSAQRNFGARQARGEYILYLDADMILSFAVISECVKTCEEKSAIALYIPERITGSGFWIKARDFERGFYNATCIDAVRFIRKDKFLEVGGFDETLTGPEDWDFDRRIKPKGRTAIIGSPFNNNEVNFRLKKYIKVKLFYARTFDSYINKWGKNDSLLKKQLGFRYRYFGVFLEKWKVFRLLSHPVLTIKMYLLRLLIGLMYISKI
jgi:glycosyltransferase involved in cell wall biosynthesis